MIVLKIQFLPEEKETLRMNGILDTNEGKLRIIQETVPGKQVTLAHVIASPDEIVYKKLGLNPSIDYQKAAIGILSMTPSEISVIAGDLAIKTANIEMGFIDRFSGTLMFTGRISEVESAIRNILVYLRDTLKFTICEITKT